MSDRPHHRRVHVAFEPSRFCPEQLVRVYEQLKPMESREVFTSSSHPRKTRQPRTQAIGGQS